MCYKYISDHIKYCVDRENNTEAPRREWGPPAESLLRQTAFGSPVSAGQFPAGPPVTAAKCRVMRNTGGTAEGKPFVLFGTEGLFFSHK